MRFWLFIFTFLTIGICAQKPSPEYFSIIKKADSLYYEKEYINSALLYTEAFRTFGNKGLIPHRFKAARSYAMANFPDSALTYLEKIVKKGLIDNVSILTAEPNFNSLHQNKRWTALIDSIKSPTIHKNASAKSDGAVTITLKNGLQEAVGVYWINFKGREIFYFDLEPNQEKQQQTYAGHIWIVKTNKNYKQIKEFRVEIDSDKIIIE